MNTPRTKPIFRYDKERHPKNRDLPNLAIFQNGVADEEIRNLLGELVAEWSHLEECMENVFALLAGLTVSGIPDTARSRPIFRSIISQDVRIKIMRFLLEETEANKSQPAFFDKAIDEFESLNGSRNKYVHGLWFSHEGKTYLASTDPARHAFETKTRKVNSAELRNFLKRMELLAGAITQFQVWRMMPSFSAMPAPIQERFQRLLRGEF